MSGSVPVMEQLFLFIIRKVKQINSSFGNALFMCEVFLRSHCITQTVKRVRKLGTKRF